MFFMHIVGLHISHRKLLRQRICPMTQDEFKTGHYECILNLLRITMTGYILHDLI